MPVVTRSKNRTDEGEVDGEVDEVVTREPDRTYGTSLHDDIRDGGKLFMTTTDKSRVLRFCAKHAISAHALPITAGRVLDLMEYLEYDTKDTVVFDHLVRKLLGFIFRNVTSSGLVAGWLEEQPTAPGKSRAGWKTRWRVVAQEWMALDTELLEENGAKTGYLAVPTGEWNEWKNNEWISQAMVLKKVNVAHKAGATKARRNLSTTPAAPIPPEPVIVTKVEKVYVQPRLYTEIRDGFLAKNESMTSEELEEWLNSTTGANFVLEMLTSAKTQAEDMKILQDKYAAKERDVEALNAKLEKLMLQMEWEKKVKAERARAEKKAKADAIMASMMAG